MKKAILLKPMLLLFALIVGSSSVWAEEVELTLSISDYASAHNWANSTAYTDDISLNSDITVSCVSGGNNGKYYTSNTSWRHYEGDNGAVTIATTSGTLKSITFTYASGNSGVLVYNNSNVSTGTTCTAVDGETLAEFSVSHSGGTRAGNVQIQSIVVKYIPAASSATLASIAISGSYPTTFAKGSEFSHAGMIVTATYDDDITKDISSLASFTGYDMNTTGTQSVQVSYTEGDVTAYAFYSIKVKNAAGLVFDPSSTVVYIGDEASVTFTKATDATVSFEVANPTIATFDATTGKVRGLKTGTTKITATSEETDGFAAGVAECTIIVTDPTWIDFTAQDYENAQDVTTVNGTYGSITFNKGSNANGNGPKWYDSGSAIRIYEKNTIKITANTGYVLTSIEFSKTQGASMLTDDFNETVTVSTDNANEYVLSTPVQEITYTHSPSTQLRLDKVKLNVAKIITPAKAVTTYVTTDKLDFEDVEGGLEAFVATAAANGVVTLAKVNAVPAGTPLLLRGTASTNYTVPVVASATAPTTNLLRAGDGTTPVGGPGVYDYVLSNGKWYHIGPDASAVNVGKAYLHCEEDPLAGGAPDLSMDWGEGTTAIKSIERTINDNQYYTLDGRRVAEPTKGLYILNGKKVIVK